MFQNSPFMSVTKIGIPSRHNPLGLRFNSPNPDPNNLTLILSELRGFVRRRFCPVTQIRPIVHITLFTQDPFFPFFTLGKAAKVAFFIFFNFFQPHRLAKFLKRWR